MQDELADMLEQADEVQEALGRTYGMQDVDDDELAAELDALGDELVLDNDSSYLDDVLKAPEAPSNKPEAETSRNKASNYIRKVFISIISFLNFCQGSRDPSAICFDVTEFVTSDNFSHSTVFFFFIFSF